MLSYDILKDDNTYFCLHNSLSFSADVKRSLLKGFFRWGALNALGLYNFNTCVKRRQLENSLSYYLYHTHLNYAGLAEP